MSLRTTSYREAEHLATVLDSEFSTFFEGQPTMADVKQLLRQRLKDSLAADREQHLSARSGRAVYGGDYHGVDPLDTDEQIISGLLSDARERLARRETRHVEDEVGKLLQAHSLPEEVRSELAIGLLNVEVRVLESCLDRVLHGVQIDLESDNLVRPDVPVTKSDGQLLSVVWPMFVELMVTEEGWRGQTVSQNSTTYKMFIECCGDRSADSYERTDCADFYDLLRGLPTLYSKKKEWRDLGLEQIVDRTRSEDIERLSMKTISRHFSALGRLFNHLRTRGEFVGENPAHGFEFPTKGRASKKRMMWEGEKLTKLFSSPVWMGCYSQSRRSAPGKIVIRDSKYWLPLLGLYHGNRLEEFAQLLTVDVKQEDGISYFDINDDGGKQVKNEQSKRRVPVHPKLVELGFLDHVAEVAADSGEFLFPDLKPGGPDNKRGYYFTKWWTRYRKAIGVYERGLDYHSFRHGVTTKLYAASVPEAHVDELTGHDGGGTSRKVYKKEMPLTVIHQAIAKVKWPEVTL